MGAASVRIGSHPRPPRKLRVTQKRIDANRRNALYSTGPRTREGKAKVRLNAVRHGLRATDEVFFATVGNAATTEIAELVRYFWRKFNVSSPFEGALVRDLAIAAWKLRYASEAEERSGWPEMAGFSQSERRRCWAFIGVLTSFQARAARLFDRTLMALVEVQQSMRSQTVADRPARESAGEANQDREIRRTNPLAGGIVRGFAADSVSAAEIEPRIARSNSPRDTRLSAPIQRSGPLTGG